MKGAKTKPKPAKSGVIIRWLIKLDMPEVLDIESRSFEVPWTAKKFASVLRQTNTIGSVAESTESGSVYGFMVYELYDDGLVIRDFAVAPEVRRTGVGTAMINRLIEKLSRQKRTLIAAHISERNMAGQMFFANAGFKAQQFFSDYFEVGEGLIGFVYTAVPKWQGVNRITEHLSE